MKMVDVMTPCPYQIEGTATVDVAIEKMALRSIRHMPVVDKAEFVGVISDRDAKLSKYVCQSMGFCPPVGDVCTKNPYIVNEEDEVSDVALEMANRKIDCALVSDKQGNMVGIFTTTDACRLIHLILEEINDRG